MNAPRKLQLFCTLLVIVSLTLLARSQNQASELASLATLIENYYDAYSKKDLSALVRLWSERSPDLPAGIMDAQRALSAEDYVVSNPTISRVRIAENKAILEITANATITNIQTKAVRQERYVRRFAVIKDRGEWKIWRDAPASEDLTQFLEKGSEWKVSADSIEQFAKELVNADEASRDRLLAENKKIVTSQLADSLTRKVGPLLLPGSYDRAIAVLRLVQRIAEQLDDKARIATAERDIGDAYREAGRPTEALKHYQEAVSKFAALGRNGSMAATLMSIGQLLFSQKNHKAAIESYEKALAEYEKLKNNRATADALEELASVHYDQEAYDRALEYFQRSLKLREVFAGKAEIAATINSIGNVYFQRHEYDEAIQHYQKALTAFEELSDTDAIVSTTGNIASAHYSQGNYEAALDHYRRAMKLQDAVRDKNVAGNLRLAIARVFSAQGNFSPALQHLNSALAVFESLRNKGSMAEVLSEMGDIYNQLHSYTLALDYYQRSLKIYEDLKSLAESSMRLYAIGNVQFMVGAFDASIESYQKALAQFEALKHAPGVASMFASIGGVLYAQQKYDLAIELYQKSLAAYDVLGDKSRAAGVIERIASVRYSKGQYLESLELSARAIELAEQQAIPDTLWRARLTQGLAYRAVGNLDQAKQSLELSIAAIESMRRKLVHGEPEAQRFYQNKNAAYLAMMELLVDQKNVGEAFTYAERARANRLIDILQRAEITKSMTAAELESERKLARAVVATKAQMNHERERRRPDLQRYATLQLRLQKSLDDYRSFETTLYAAHPVLQTLRGESAQMKTEDIHGLLSDSATGLIEFSVADTRTYLFALTRQSTRAPGARSQTYALNVYVINAGRLDISDRVSKFREMIARRDEKVQQPAREIFNLLFSSASSQLSGKTTWLIVPDDSLWQLPFQALQLPDNRFVIEEHVVAYAPSLSALFEMSKPRTTARVGRQLTAAFFANPAISKQTAERLSLTATEKLAPSLESEAEVKSLERIYSAAQSKVFIGAQASEEAAKQANGFNVIHFAAPAQLNEANPLYSHVALSQSEENGNEDGLLEAWEMMKLDLKADFVVFSASEAIVRSGGGDGFAGLAWSLFVGGCPVVVASRWRADGPATNALMTEFHRELQFSRGRQRLTSKAQALQRATLALLNRSNYREPYYWAGFVVMDRK